MDMHVLKYDTLSLLPLPSPCVPPYTPCGHHMHPHTNVHAPRMPTHSYAALMRHNLQYRRFIKTILTSEAPSAPSSAPTPRPGSAE